MSTEHKFNFDLKWKNASNRYRIILLISFLPIIIGLGIIMAEHGLIAVCSGIGIWQIYKRYPRIVDPPYQILRIISDGMGDSM